MNALRESPMRRRPPRRRRPVWGIVGIVVAGTAVLLALAVGLAWLLGSSDEPAAAPSPQPLPCRTAMVVPAELLPAASSVVVNVLNSTDRSGLAAQTADDLRARDYRVKKVGNAPSSEPVVAGVAELRFGAKGEGGARRLAFLVPGARLVPIERSGKRVDLVLGTGFTALADEGVAAGAMASPSPSVSGPGCPTPSPEAS